MHDDITRFNKQLGPDDEFWRGKRVLVTGATGFLGGWLIRELLDRDAEVVALVRRPKPQSQFDLCGFSRDVTVEPGDVSDRQLIESLLDRHQFDAVFHTTLAGGDVNASLADPVDCFRSTVESTLWLLDAIRRKHPNVSLVVSSSDKAYGGQDVPYREDSALSPVHPQEVCKASEDLLAQSFGKVYDLKVAITRCANYYGPFDFNFSRIVPFVAKCIAENVSPVLRSDGQFVRDFIYIREAAWAHLDLARMLHQNLPIRGEAFNFSYGEPRTALDLVMRLISLAKSDLQPIIRDEARHEIRNMMLSSDKARSELGWRPRLGFDESLAQTVDWYRRYLATDAGNASPRGQAGTGG
jgi:CDP-glucose 4,6-dehydratase